jgi:hypothetical protein
MSTSWLVMPPPFRGVRQGGRSQRDRTRVVWGAAERGIRLGFFVRKSTGGRREAAGGRGAA